MVGMMEIRQIGHIDAAPRCSSPGRAVFGRLPHYPPRKNRVIDGSLGPRIAVVVDLLMPSTATDQIYRPDIEGLHFS